MSAGDDDLVNSDRLREQAAGQRELRDRDRLQERAAEQRAMVRWWAAECRQRNAACRRRFSAANVAAATEARAILRDYARAWTQTRELSRGSGAVSRKA